MQPIVLLSGLIILGGGLICAFLSNASKGVVAAFGSSEAAAWIQAIGIFIAIVVPYFEKQYSKYENVIKERMALFNLLTSFRNELIVFKAGLSSIKRRETVVFEILKKEKFPALETLTSNSLLITNPFLFRSIFHYQFQLNTLMEAISLHNQIVHDPDTSAAIKKEVAEKTFVHVLDMRDSVLKKIEGLIKDINDFTGDHVNDPVT